MPEMKSGPPPKPPRQSPWSGTLPEIKVTPPPVQTKEEKTPIVNIPNRFVAQDYRKRIATTLSTPPTWCLSFAVGSAIAFAFLLVQSDLLLAGVMLVIFSVLVSLSCAFNARPHLPPPTVTKVPKMQSISPPPVLTNESDSYEKDSFMAKLLAVVLALAMLICLWVWLDKKVIDSTPQLDAQDMIEIRRMKEIGDWAEREIEEAMKELREIDD